MYTYKIESFVDGEKVSYEYLTKCLYDFDVDVFSVCCLSISVCLLRKILFAKIAMGADLKQKKQKRKRGKLSWGFLHLREM